MWCVRTNNFEYILEFKKDDLKKKARLQLRIWADSMGEF